ncbi:energy-coupling factor ABC transporter ATP-binding protein [Paracoccus onubensis]|uniref:ABC transporter ATP-binding protein n=1 Tax=Paracoccus onubensis TaxID=1675788 RepID=A0A418SPJ3_9RHOB|nr:ABC transporter ATP-binding protein [Paracoccus onubensis]RJE82859.1 ABC transporter ATP-binding protein [Paracoccus onubensis]
MAISSANNPVLLEDVGYRINDIPVLSGVSVRSESMRIGVIGRNGSGKSTLARLIAGLLEPSEGQIRIEGVDVYKDRRAAIRTVGILFQNPEHQIIFPTVSEEIGFGLRQLGASKADAVTGTQKLLARFGKAHWQDAPIHALSQGQKHLVCMMSVLAMRPRLLVLDEPFAGLDIPTRMQLTRHLNDAGTRLLHITHDTRDLEDYDQVFWLDRGRLRASGVARQVLQDFTQEMVRIGGGDDLSLLAG